MPPHISGPPGFLWNMVAAIIAAQASLLVPGNAAPMANVNIKVGTSYTWDLQWPKDNTSWVNMTYRPTGVAFAPSVDGNSVEIHMAARGNREHPITTFDAAGNVLRRWGHPDIIKAHSIQADVENGRTFLWVTDMGDYTVKKFDGKTGELLLVIGVNGTSGTGINPLQFGNVSDIAFSPDHSTVFIADGDCLCLSGGSNHRVVAVSTKTLEVQWVVGNDGTFQNPHAVSYDAKRQWVWVADREHNRTVALDAISGQVRGSWSVHDLAPVSHRPSVNGLRVDSKRDLLVLGLMPAPIHSRGGEFQVAVWDIGALVASPNKLPPPLFQQPIPVAGLHELDVDEHSGDLYLALYEVGQVAHLYHGGSVRADSMTMAKVGAQPNFSLCDEIDRPPEIISHHLHVVFHGADRASMVAALTRRKEFMVAVGITGTPCPMAHSDPAPTYSGICSFPFEFDPSSFPVTAGGPFEGPNFSFFVSDKFLQLAMTWWQARRRYMGGELDILVHANSGCQLNDHTAFAMWMGTKWEMNTVGLACCLHGPAGCSCYDTYYIARSSISGRANESKCLTVNKTQGSITYQTCDLSAFDPSFMWHEVTYQNGYNQIDSLGWSLGSESGVDNCMGVASCQAGVALSMAACRQGQPHKTLFRFVSSDDGSDFGRIVSDSCEGLCMLLEPITGKTELGNCSDPKAAVERRCIMAPGQAPVPCPQKFLGHGVSI